MRLFLIGALSLPLSMPAAEDIALSSPNGQVQFRLISSGKTLEYAITLKQKPVIDRSPLGIVVDRINLGEGADIGSIARYQRNETYPWHGGRSTATDRANGARIPLTHRQSKTPYTLEVRVFDDGVAFRHLVAGAGTHVPDEATAFRIPAQSTLWYHDLEDHYEGIYKRKSIASVPAGEWAAPPLTFRLPGDAGYGSITEGALTNYSGMALQGDGDGAFHARLGHAVPASWPFRLRYKEDVARLREPAAVTGPITTPWRIVMATPDLNTLVNSDIVHNVAAPPDPKLFPDGVKTDWVKPGRAVWSYLDGGTNTLEGMKEFSRLAGELGFEYNILEGFWSRWPEAQLKDLVDYSRERGVRILVWRGRRSLSTPAQIRELFDLCKRTGVAGVKIDFFDHEHKEIIDLYETTLKLAAEYKLIVDFHGANKPTGQERTWPNELGFEGIRGLEMRPPFALQDVTLPFTRMLAGLADYTPVHFGRKLADTTWAHQVANAVILNAPLLVYGAHPANILANPMADLIKGIPSVWDETVVLPVSDIGQVAAFARRKGPTWYLAITNGPEAKSVSVDLSFLAVDGRGASYQSTLARDTGEAEAVKMEHRTLSSTDALSIDLRSGGGFIARFRR